MGKSVSAFQSQLLVKYAICMPQNLVIRVYVYCFVANEDALMLFYNKRLMTMKESVHMVFDEINYTDQGSTKNYAEEDEQNIIL